jgi:hypothetical protein
MMSDHAATFPGDDLSVAPLALRCVGVDACQ